MATAFVDIGATAEMFAGEDKTFRFTVKDAAGNLVDIQTPAYRFDFHLRLSPDAPTILVPKLNIVPSGGSTFDVLFVSADTKTMKQGTYWYGVARNNAGAWDVEDSGKFLLYRSAVHAT